MYRPAFFHHPTRGSQPDRDAHPPYATQRPTNLPTYVPTLPYLTSSAPSSRFFFISPCHPPLRTYPALPHHEDLSSHSTRTLSSLEQTIQYPIALLAPSDASWNAHHDTLIRMARRQPRAKQGITASHSSGRHPGLSAAQRGHGVHRVLAWRRRKRRASGGSSDG